MHGLVKNVTYGQSDLDIYGILHSHFDHSLYAPQRGCDKIEMKNFNTSI
jgi:hypothetical protein